MAHLESFVKLVSDTDDRESAWRMSRPNILPGEPVDVSAFSKADFGINDQRYVRLHFRSSVLFRELLMTVRGAQPWAQTSRVKPIIDTKLSGEYSGLTTTSEAEQSILQAASSGAQDVARLDVPISASTEYYWGAPWRSVVCFIKTLERKCPSLFLIYGIEMMKCLDIQDLDFYMYDSKGGMDTTVGFSEEDHDAPFDSITGFGTTITKFRTTFGHSSHFVRHAHNQYRSTIWDIATQPLSQHNVIDSHSSVDIITAMPKASLMTMLSHRSSFLADWNVWSNFVEASTRDYTTKEFFELIDDPISFLEDNMKRVEHMDPGLPDPWIVEDPSMVSRRIAKEGTNYIGRRYLDMINEGYITDNPENVHRKKYESMFATPTQYTKHHL
ncbi:hypothetical protein NVP1031O_026 [Vibrio phage 1.031.O._10N.261.46.F8]|nr:hypothetical protein NVP1031O_026 [Vibrio phage 1.031.O._10N.261.46.F8]